MKLIENSKGWLIGFLILLGVYIFYLIRDVGFNIVFFKILATTFFLIGMFFMFFILRLEEKGLKK